VAVIGGRAMGVETADFILQDEDRSVVVVEMMHDVLLDISHDAKSALLDKLYKKPYRHVVDTKLKAVTDDNGELALHVERYGLPDVMRGFDTVVMAIGVEPNDDLGQSLLKTRDDVYLVGDCEGPGDYRKAVHDAAEVALSI
jgi:pyruvate/2-oxoglutarate dehydrogenase complex dihydrolipoamide dehydrogenase (E3) component